MKKFTIQLTGDRRINIWANNSEQAISDASQQFPSNEILEIFDTTPVNPAFAKLEQQWRSNEPEKQK